MRQGVAISLIVVVIACSSACSRSRDAPASSAQAPALRSLATGAMAAGRPHVCVPIGNDGFITSIFQCLDQVQGYPLSVAQVENYSYIVYYGGGLVPSPEIISTSDNGNNLLEPAFYMNAFMSIAASQGKLYVAWTSADTKLNFGWAKTNAGVITDLLPLSATQNQGTDGTPAIAATADGSSFFMGWPSKTLVGGEPTLNFVKFPFPPPSTNLENGFGNHSELRVKNDKAPVSIAVIGKTPYVAYEVDGLACQIVKFSEDGHDNQGGFISGEGCKTPSLAVSGQKLYVASRSKTDQLHLNPVTLDGRQTPTGLGTAFPNPNQQYDEAGAVIAATPSGLMIVWREKQGNNLRIGTVKLP